MSQSLAAMRQTFVEAVLKVALSIFQSAKITGLPRIEVWSSLTTGQAASSYGARTWEAYLASRKVSDRALVPGEFFEHGIREVNVIPDKDVSTLILSPVRFTSHRARIVNLERTTLDMVRDAVLGIAYLANKGKWAGDDMDAMMLRLRMEQEFAPLRPGRERSEKARKSWRYATFHPEAIRYIKAAIADAKLPELPPAAPDLVGFLNRPNEATRKPYACPLRFKTGKDDKPACESSPIRMSDEQAENTAILCKRHDPPQTYVLDKVTYAADTERSDALQSWALAEDAPAGKARRKAAKAKARKAPAKTDTLGEPGAPPAPAAPAA